MLANTSTFSSSVIIDIWTQRLYYIIAIDDICFDESYSYVKWTTLLFYYNWWYIVIIRFWVFDVSIFLIGSRLLDTLFLIDYWFRLSCTSLHQLLVHLFLIGQRFFNTLFWLINKFIFNAQACTRFWCTAQKL